METRNLGLFAQWNIEFLSFEFLVGIPLVTAFIWVMLHESSYSSSSLPVFNDRKTFEFSWNKAKERFRSEARDILFGAFSKFPNAFYVVTDVGVELMLDSHFAPEITNDTRFSMWGLVQKKYFGNLPGFQVFGGDPIASAVFADVIKTKVTRNLGKESMTQGVEVAQLIHTLTRYLDHTIEPIDEEAIDALESFWTDNSDWHDIDLSETLLQLTAQQTSRIFLGKDLCRNPEWLRITQGYVRSLFKTAELLRAWPRILCPLVARLLPACRELRKYVQEARTLMAPVLEARKAKWKSEGTPTSVTSSDAIDWFEEISRGRPYDPVIAQLRLALSSIHTTTDLLIQTLCDLCMQPELVESLREEIRANMNSDAKGATRLYNMKLLDSVLKESQRMKPVTFTPISKEVKETVQLSNGLTLKKGQTVNITAHGMWDDAVWPNASQYDGYRYARMREAPGEATSHQLVSLHPNHIGFGLGREACPGRFFAAMELKISLCHILMKYDFKFADGQEAKIDWHGVHLSPNHDVKLSIKRRQSGDVITFG